MPMLMAEPMDMMETCFSVRGSETRTDVSWLISSRIDGLTTDDRGHGLEHDSACSSVAQGVED